MVSRDGAFGILIGAAIGTCSLVLACGPPQDAQLVSCADVDMVSPLEDLTRCAEQGNARAQSRLGVLYDLGLGVSEDDAEAVRLYRLAADQGYADAQVALGWMYANGEGVPEDQVYAYMWFKLSAAQGNETAQSNKEIVERVMTREQIAEAQRLSREWIETHPQDGGN